MHPFAPPNQALHIFQNWSRIQTKRKRQHSGLNIAQQPGSVGIDVWGKASRMVLMYGASGQHTASCSVIDHVFFSPLGLLCCPSYFCSTCLYCPLLLLLLCPAACVASCCKSGPDKSVPGAQFLHGKLGYGKLGHGKLGPGKLGPGKLGTGKLAPANCNVL